MNLTEFLGGVLKPISDAYSKRQERKQIEHTVNIELIKTQAERQSKLISEGLAADAAWELEFAKQAASSWKDEFTLIVISVPAILCFIPGLDVYVSNGFKALDKTPLWYQIIFGSIFLATYGIRYWRKTQSDT